MSQSELFFGNTLVLGAGGFVGRALIPRLHAYTSQIRAVVRDRDLVFPGVDMRYGDLTDSNFCAAVLEGVDTVIYLAGYKKNIAHHTRESFDFVIGNTQPLTTFLAVLKHASVRRMVYLSTTHAATEWQSATDGYAIGKHVNELLLETFAQQTKLPICTIRSCGIYGPGDSFDPDSANFIPALIMRVDQCTGVLEVWGKGERRMQFLYIDDLVANLLAAPCENSLYTIGNPETHSVQEIVTMILSIMGKTCVIAHDVTKPDKNTNLFTFTNIVSPNISLTVGLERMVAYYRTLS